MVSASETVKKRLIMANMIDRREKFAVCVGLKNIGQCAGTENLRGQFL